MFTCRAVIRSNSCDFDAPAEVKEEVLQKMRKELWSVPAHSIRQEEPPESKEKGRGKRKSYCASDFLDSKGCPLEGYRILSAEDQHRFCPDGEGTWCKFKRNDPKYNPRKYLDPVFWEAIFHIWVKLTKRDFLQM